MKIDALARLVRVTVAVFAASFAWTCFAQPTFTSQTWDLTVNVGDTATFSVTATGSGPISYQWRKNGNDIPGATASSYTITNCQTSDAAGYYCQATDNGGPNWSGTAHLTVNGTGTAPKVTDQTWDQTVNVGASVTFSVTATGTAPLAYQWRKNGNDIPGANASTFTINNVQTSDAAGYYCAVTNSYGADWSGTANLTVNGGTAPKVTDQTWDQTVNVGASVTFSVTATGTAPLAYQWRKNGNDIAGANASTFTINNVQTSDAAGYYCAVTNSYGADWSGTANLTVNAGTAPKVTGQTWDQTVNVGGTATFSVTATGSAPLAYQWRKNGNDIPGANASSFTITNAQASDAAGYYCAVTNSYGADWSGTANLTVTSAGTAPTITAQPQSQTVNVGASTTFSVTATGTTPLSYQWRKNSANITNATSSSYTIASTQTTDAGNYDVVVTNAYGTQTSTAATLTVNSTPTAPTITTQPQNQTVAAGNTATFSVTATGNPAPTYQWRKNSVNLTNGTNATLNLPNVQSTDAGNYDVVVTNSAGTVTSNTAALTVSAGSGSLTIVEHPRTQRVTIGKNVVFTVTATGTGSLAYQWHKGSAILSGATSASLFLSSVQPDNAGDYYVVASDANGSATSVPATLVVEPAPSTSQPVIIDVHTAAPKVLVVVVQTPTTYVPEGRTQSDDLSAYLGTTQWTLDNNAQPTAVHRYSIPWDEDPLNSDPNHPYTYPVRTRHRLYLVFNSPLAEGAHVLSTPFSGNPTNFIFSSTGTLCESIKVNQVGYSGSGQTRFANFGIYLGDGGPAAFDRTPVSTETVPSYQVIDETTGQPVWTGGLRQATDLGSDTGSQNHNSGEHVYRLDLSALTAGGPYFVYVDGAGRSRSFMVGGTSAGYLSYMTFRGLYHQRCGLALEAPYTDWIHDLCHPQISYWLRSSGGNDSVDVTAGPGPADLAPVSGGYHDAADMDHNLAHAQISIDMLSFFEAFAPRFKDGQYRLPESGNGIPDMLDEILWGVKMWERLQIWDDSPKWAFDPAHDFAHSYGGVMSGWAPNGYTSYGYDDAAHDPRTYGTYLEQVSTTAYCAGIFAHASRMLTLYGGSTQAQHASDLLTRAKAAWTYVENHGGFNEVRAHFMYAALQLYLAVPTSDAKSATYHSVFKTQAQSLVLNGTNPDGSALPDRVGFDPGNLYFETQIPHFISYLLPQTVSIDDAIKGPLTTKVQNLAQSGTSFAALPTTSTYPLGLDQGGMGWGDCVSQGRYAATMMYAYATTSDTSLQQQYVNAISLYADYSLGLNPMGLSYYTGLGADQPNSPMHCNSYFTKYGKLHDGTDGYLDAAGNPIGNVPGILVYGPSGEGTRYYNAQSGQMQNSFGNYEYPVVDKLVPLWDNLPPQRRYAHGWSMAHINEFTTHETITWNALMYAFLATH